MHFRSLSEFISISTLNDKNKFSTSFVVRER